MTTEIVKRLREAGRFSIDGDLLREAADAIEAQGWRSIAEAPRDGTLIDLWTTAYGGERLANCSWDDLVADEGEWRQRYSEAMGSSFALSASQASNVTHFMPIPPPPKDADAQG